MDDTLPADYGSPGGTPSQLANLSSSTSLGAGYGASSSDVAANDALAAEVGAYMKAYNVDNATATAAVARAHRQANTQKATTSILQGVAAATQAIQQSGVLPGTGKFVGSGRASPPAPPPPPAANWKPWALGAVAVFTVGGLAWWALKPEPVRSTP